MSRSASMEKHHSLQLDPMPCGRVNTLCNKVPSLFVLAALAEPGSKAEGTMPAQKRFVQVLRDVFTELGALDNISVHYDEFAPIVARRWKELGHGNRFPRFYTGWPCVFPCCSAGCCRDDFGRPARS